MNSVKVRVYVPLHSIKTGTKEATEFLMRAFYGILTRIHHSFETKNKNY